MGRGLLSTQENTTRIPLEIVPMTRQMPPLENFEDRERNIEI
jgi:hypothetical protein